MTGWSNGFNARKYDEYARQFGTYNDTSRDLVDFAEVKPGMWVIDLACGTGVTSQAVLDVLDGTGHLHSVDRSQAMLEIAHQHMKADNLSFHLSRAESMHQVIHEPVDRVVCNSAFWQTDSRDTLAAIRSTLKPGGKLAYNLPGPFFKSAEMNTGAGQGADLGLLMREVARTEFGIQPPLPVSSRYRKYRPTLDDVRSILNQNGFALTTYKVITYQQSLEAASAFYTIPVMTERVLVGVNYETRMAILSRAKAQLDPNYRVSLPWLFIRAEIIA
jgi:ubiquinone/menaquinone biosynthesis C-methylase UbiE